MVWAVVKPHPIRDSLTRITVFDDRIRWVRQAYEQCCVHFGGTFPQYLQTFSSKMRSTRVQKVRKFAELCGGRTNWREYRSPEEIDHSHRLARDLSRKIYQEKVLDAGLPEGADFERAMRTLSGQGAVRAYFLFRDDKPIGHLYSPITDGVGRYQFLGFDPAFRDHSPGTVLQYHVLECLFGEKRLRMFDFLEEKGQHKKLSATRTRFVDVYYYRRGLKNRTLVGLHPYLGDLST